jgi:hypothetical protein
MKRLGSGGLLGLEVIFGWIACLEGAVRGFWKFHVEDSRVELLVWCVFLFGFLSLIVYLASRCSDLLWFSFGCGIDYGLILGRIAIEASFFFTKLLEVLSV